jgi:hypothetical protein
MARLYRNAAGIETGVAMKTQKRETLNQNGAALNEVKR